MNLDIIGHKKVLNFFDKVIDRENLSHAYCFVGTPFVGKKTVAKKIASRLLSVEQDKLKTNPDFYIIERELNQKTGKTKKNIDIDQIRGLRRFMSSRPLNKGYKVAIINDADIMNDSSANALLKTLEEPGINTVIFLIINEQKSVPETIISRTQTIYFAPVDKKEIYTYLISKKIDEKRAEEMSRLSLGLPGLAVKWIDDEDAYENYRQEVKNFCYLFQKPFYKKIEIVEHLFGDKKDHIVTRENLKSVLNIWQLLLRDNLLKSFSNSSCIFQLDIEFVKNKKDQIKIIDTIEETKKMLDRNIHPRLLVEKILTRLP
ncbi:MAG: hypothetical protein GF349_03795 [Candidatus Magasanikbacteria bacterium]|nr:hypothetical protein [Candidatus Magasanikbacteria bacterium]